MGRPRTGRPLVLVHGTRMHRAQWEPYRELLPELSITTLDLPGHGERAGETFTADAALGAIDDAVCRARRDGDGEPPVLVGHSLGGYLAMVWAAQQRDELAALVMIGATGDPTSRLAHGYRAFAWLTPRFDPERLARASNAVMRRLGARGAHAEALPGGAGYAALPAAWEFVLDSAHPGLLGAVECPVVLINGQFDQMRVNVRRFAARARDAQVITIARASHLLPATHPQELAQILRRVATD